MKKFTVLFLSTIGLLAATAAAAPSVTQDTFVYEFLPTFNFDSPPFNALLSSGETGTGHATRSFIQLDLSGVTLQPGQTALLNLWVDPTEDSGFGVSPSASAPVEADIYPVTGGSWDATTITWGNQPGTGALATSGIISGVNQWVSFDITSLVQSWIANPATNLGLAIEQPAAVQNSGFVVAVCDSTAGTNAPYLQIVPEPATLGAVGIAAMVCLRRRNFN